MGIGDVVRSWTINWLFGGEDWSGGERGRRYEELRQYYEGEQRRQLKQREGQADDNLVENLAGLIIERGVSMMLGTGVELELGEAGEQAVVDEVLEANDFQAQLYDMAENAGIYGTGFIKLQPGGVESMEREDVRLVRVIVLDPRWMRIITPVEDIGTVTGYEMRYNVPATGPGVAGEAARREVTEVYGRDEAGNVVSWVIRNYRSDGDSQGRWVLVDEVVWEYEFPPILHWKNLPKANDCYGKPDIGSVIELQDRLNFVGGNISKIIRYHGHPRTWGRGLGQPKEASWGADEMIVLSGEQAMVQNLEMQSDLSSSRLFRQDLRSAIFDIARVVDPTIVKDKIGQLTNFGLRVLYYDMLNKTETKRLLLGRALVELAHRVLVVEGGEINLAIQREGRKKGVKVIWAPMLPVNDEEQTVADGFDLEQGLASKETVATRRGYDWVKEQERLGEEQAAGDSVGAAILRAFDRGGERIVD